MLEAAGFPRRPEQTAREFAGDAARRRPDFSAAAELAELHYRELYSQEGLGPADSLRGERLLRELAAATRRGRSRL
ncbi:MAG: DUF4129 domain-containing protein [Elusimicrobia bacterium]|nr:DUF4129 domain-containing protein [Elusimicrobiota bacterium]